MARRLHTWKCRDCGMTGHKEPHRTLPDHMAAAHNKIWSEKKLAYVPAIEQKLEWLRSCITTGKVEDAQEHCFDILRGLSLQTRPDEQLTPEGRTLKNICRATKPE